MLEINKTIKSKRDTNIPVTIVDSETENASLVIFAHGFKADRHEGGRFSDVARKLAEVGINSIRMGFPGCDESKEDFINYTINNCLDDIESSYQYMLNNYSINNEHLGIVGYSMGGRLASIFVNKHPEFKTLGLWTGAVYKDFGGNNDCFLGGNVASMKKQANELGYTDFYNDFDNTNIKLSKALIDEMELYNPLEYLNSFEGSAIVCHGDNDFTVVLDTAYLAINNLTKAKNKKLVIINGANHGFGLWDDHMEQSYELVDETTKFIKEHL